MNYLYPVLCWASFKIRLFTARTSIKSIVQDKSIFKTHPALPFWNAMIPSPHGITRFDLSISNYPSKPPTDSLEKLSLRNLGKSQAENQPDAISQPSLPSSPCSLADVVRCTLDGKGASQGSFVAVSVDLPWVESQTPIPSPVLGVMALWSILAVLPSLSLWRGNVVTIAPYKVLPGPFATCPSMCPCASQEAKM